MANDLSMSPDFLNESIPLMPAIYRTNSNADVSMQIRGLPDDCDEIW
jgi:hypothetical protein